MAQRAAVLIGVSRTGDLPTLRAATDGARAMQRWAIEHQGMDPALVKLLTDDAGRVEVNQVKDAIAEIVDRATVDQLIVYFAGHGVNIRYGEYWLLSRAPRDTQAAVNVEGSVVLARQCGIPHVVLISDACRTAAEGLQAQYVTGSEVFPNDAPGGVEQGVDLFFACTLGKPALEVRDPAAAARRFSAVYTDALVEVLDGRRGELLERRAGVGLVRPRPLKRHLQAEVARRLAALRVEPNVSQTPDARITSDEEAWLAQVPLAPPAAEQEEVRGQGSEGLGQAGKGGFSIGADGQSEEPVRGPAPRSDPPSTTLHAVSHAALRDALAGRSPVLSRSLETAGRAGVREARQLGESAARTAALFGPLHFETGCGFKIRGARLVDAYSPRARTELLGDGGDLLRIDGIAGPAANVLLSFADGKGVVLPAIPEFLAALTFEEGELVNVTYEPSEGSARWDVSAGRRDELRTLRGVVSSAARFGVFRLEGEDAPALARRMQLAKGIDPTMALYAAYAYQQLQSLDRLHEMQSFLHDDLRLRLFDLALLAHGLDGRQAGAVENVFPFLPLLAQGWALLAAHRVALPPALAGIQRHLLPSLWTLFDEGGVAKVRSAMQTEEVR